MGARAVSGIGGTMHRGTAAAMERTGTSADKGLEPSPQPGLESSLEPGPLTTPEGDQERAPAPAPAPGLDYARAFAREGVDPFDEIEWDAAGGGDRQREGRGGLRAARRRSAEVLVAASHQHRRLEVLPRHASARRSASAASSSSSAASSTRSPAGRARSGTSPARTTCRRSADELKHLLVYQKASFNSPVWFNVGIEPHPQCSACFINSVQDTMDSILSLARTEGMLFKYGSGTGIEPVADPLVAASCWPAAARPRGRCRS